MTVKRTQRQKTRLVSADFSGDGEPYSEAIVTISIRALGAGIARSRLAVNVYPDPALEGLAKKSLESAEQDKSGYNSEGVFGARLSENCNGWEDMNGGYPRISADVENRLHKDDAERMNKYLARSVEWLLRLHRDGMEEARRNDGESGRPPKGRLM